jgi:uncharacterized protein (DUF2267 family)
MTRLAVFDTTVQKTEAWLRDIREGLGIDDEAAAYAALRATLHAVRDLLATDQVARFGAQMPILVRGLYYEGWDPAPAGAEPRRKAAFLEAIRHELREQLELRDAERVARIVLDVVTRHMTPGEVAKIAHGLPREVRALWPL